jgi:hypothetical protein
MSDEHPETPCPSDSIFLNVNQLQSLLKMVANLSEGEIGRITEIGFKRGTRPLSDEWKCPAPHHYGWTSEAQKGFTGLCMYTTPDEGLVCVTTVTCSAEPPTMWADVKMVSLVTDFVCHFPPALLEER